MRCTRSTFLRSADDLRGDAYAAAEVERADAFRAVQFVGGTGEEIDRQLVDVDRQLADVLRGVGMEPDAVLSALRADAFDRLKHASLVVGSHDGNDRDVVSTCR